MTAFVVLRLCRWDELAAQEKHGLFPSGKLSAGPMGEFGFLPVFKTLAEAEAASDSRKYEIAEISTRDPS